MDIETPSYHQHLPREFTLPARKCEECPLFSPKIDWCRRWLRKASGSCPEIKATAHYQPPRDNVYVQSKRAPGCQ